MGCPVPSRLTAREKALRAVLEADWQRIVLAIATAQGWRHYHAPRAGVRANGSVRTTTAGFPDLVLVRGPRLIFAELKRETGSPTREQVAWLTDLAGASAEVYLWRPSDLPDVQEVLRRAA